MVCIMSNDDSAAAGVAARLTRRLTRSASALAVAAVQRWAWSTMVVPVAVAIVAAVAYLVYRRGRHAIIHLLTRGAVARRRSAA